MLGSQDPIRGISSLDNSRMTCYRLPMLHDTDTNRAKALIPHGAYQAVQEVRHDGGSPELPGRADSMKRVLESALETLKVAYQMVAAKPAGMSSGELYARLSAALQWQDDSTYQAMLGLLVRSKMVKVSGHWVTALPQSR